MTKCTCDHHKKDHDKIKGCLFRYPPGDPHDFQDVQGYCVCIEWFQT